jgi:hypothetical protein
MFAFCEYHGHSTFYIISRWVAPAGCNKKMAGLLGHVEYHFEMTRKGLVFISRDVLHEEHYEDNEGIKSFFQLVLSMPFL